MRLIALFYALLWGVAYASAADAPAPRAARSAPQQVSRVGSADELKAMIREDLLAVRRARYALKKARLKSGENEIRSAQNGLDEAKKRLKQHRVRLREILDTQTDRSRRRKSDHGPSRTKTSRTFGTMGGKDAHP